MKIRVDECASNKIVQAIKLVCLSDGIELDHVRDHHEHRTPDETWIPRFAEDGGKIYISGDAAILKRPHQLVAVRDAGLASIVLSEQFTHMKRYDQAAHLMYWWPRIEQCAKDAKVGECWLVPPKFDRSLGLTLKKIDYDKPAQAICR